MNKVINSPIKTISGLRGTLENKSTDTLNSNEINQLLKSLINLLNLQDNNIKIILGRDGRHSGLKISQWIRSFFVNHGIDIIDIGLSTTPTIASSTKNEKLGIMITASHNPDNWNGIKLFFDGVGFNEDQWKFIFNTSPINLNNSLSKGNIFEDDGKKYIKDHIDLILNSHLVCKDLIKNSNLKVAIDGTNSTGSIALKMLLNSLGITQIKCINSEITGSFNRNPEPLSGNLNDISAYIKDNEYDIGFATDPDADRLAVIDENGEFWGEEYTLIACTDYLLKTKKGNVVSNMSSSIILKEITEKNDCNYYFSKVGESNVVEKIRQKKAIIGGEGNGGVIYPNINLCRDSLVGVSLILSYITKYDLKASELRKKFDNIYSLKKKISLDKNISIEKIKNRLIENFNNYSINLEDGIRIDFENSWIHIRKSNTEPILRICGESKTKSELKNLENIIINLIFEDK